MLIKRLVVSRQLPSVELFRMLILKSGFALLELHRMTTVAADARKILPKKLCLLRVGCVVDTVLLQRWHCRSGSGTGHLPQRSPELPDLCPVIQAGAVLTPRGLLGILDYYLGNALDTPAFLSVDQRPCPLQPLAGLIAFHDVARALVGPIRHTPGFTPRWGRPGNVPRSDLHH